VLHNNAGIAIVVPLEGMSDADWQWTIDVNLRGVVNGVQAFLPRLKSQDGEKHIVNTGSIAGLVGLRTLGAYGATKFAVIAISEGLRQENPDIRVTTISPGVVVTELGDDISDQSAKQQLGDLRKTALTPDAIARAIAYAVEQPDDVDVNEVIVRPTTSSF